MSQVMKRRLGSAVVIAALALVGLVALVPSAYQAAGEQAPGQPPANPLGALFGSGQAASGVLQKLERVRTDMRMMAVAIESYYVDNNVYPAFGMGPQSVNSILGKGTAAAQMPGFRLPTGKLMTLTTPIAYITTYPPDPFTTSGKATYAYWSATPGKPDPAGAVIPAAKVQPGASIAFGWILVSPGPDGDYDLLGEWSAYDPRVPQPSPRLLTGNNKKGSAFTYDPTNGLTSNGDIWRVKQ
jgi:hypothetical protein